MTPAQQAAQAAHTLALKAYRNASHGERNRTRKALELATLNVLRADNEAARQIKQQRIEVAAYAA